MACCISALVTFPAIIRSRTFLISGLALRYFAIPLLKSDVSETPVLNRNDSSCQLIYTDSFNGELSPGEYVDSEGNLLMRRKIRRSFKKGGFYYKEARSSYV